MLAYLGRNKQVLAVSGTHGKTTSSSMMATALVELEANPSFLIGGVLNAFDSSAVYGSGPYMVMEADESDASFTWLDPKLAIITNIEADHLDHFESLEQIKQSFLAFLDKLDPQGIAIICTDCPGLVELVQSSGKPYITYGSTPKADIYFAANATASSSSGSAGNSSSADNSSAGFDVIFPDKSSFQIRLDAAPGTHNMLNATAVMAALDWLGFDRQKSAIAISKFAGAHRRFDRIGEAAGVLVVDDYGHHPTEVAATLAAAQSLGFSSVHLLFQPHRYTRTQAFIKEFGAAFNHATTVTLMEIFTAGEAPIAKIDSSLVLKAIKDHNPAASVRLISKREQIATAMAELAEPGSVIITMGAGDVTKLAPEILAVLQQKAATQ
jgi:UDP-N-acetylmuramate--alanine ligase